MAVSPTRRTSVWALAGAVFAMTAFAPATLVRAQAVTDQWSSVTIPPAPDVKPVTVDPKTTALLVMDFRTAACTAQTAPRCAAALPHVQTILDAARTHQLFVVDQKCLAQRPTWRARDLLLVRRFNRFFFRRWKPEFYIRAQSQPTLNSQRSTQLRSHAMCHG